MTHGRFELAIFDLDGTLIDSARDLAASVNRALHKSSLPERPGDEVARFIGQGARRLVERAAPAGSPPGVVDGLLAAFLEDYALHLLDTTVLYPGVAELLAGPPELKAVATNKPGALSRRILAGLGVAARFVTVVGGDEAPRKPAPDMIERILQSTGVPATRAAFIGDSAIDVQTARAAGVAALAVGWGLGGPDELGGGDKFFATAGDLARYFAAG